MCYESPQMRCELRIHFGKGLTKQTLPDSFFVRCRTVGTKKYDSKVPTIEFSRCGLDQERESEVFGRWCMLCEHKNSTIF